MTAPAIADLSSITSRIEAITAQISVLTGTSTSAASPSGPAASAGTPAASGSSASAQAFASQLSSASSTAGASDTTVAAGSGDVTGAQVVSDAQRYLGIAYVFGGESTSGMDCSGLVQKTFGDLGVSMPRTAAEQQKIGTPVASLADAQPGDLLFFGSPAYHVAIYAGNNELIESPEPGKTVHEVPIYQQPTSISRIVGGSPADSSAGSAGSAVSVVSTGTSSAGAGGLSASQLSAAGLNPAVATYATQFAAAEQQYGLPSGMLAAVAQQESGGNPQAVSSVGAQGLMQLMPSTAAGMGVDAFAPDQAITAAAQILSRNLNEFGGSVPLALAAYNAGAGAVKEYGGIPPYTQTQNYVRDITAMMGAGG